MILLIFGLVLGSIITFLVITLILANKEIQSYDCKKRKINEDVREAMKEYIKERWY